MAYQKPVISSTGPTWIQSAEPDPGEVFEGASWLDNNTITPVLKTWDGSTWVTQDYLPTEIMRGIAGYTFGGGGYPGERYIQKFTFLTETPSVVASQLSVTRTLGIGTTQNQYVNYTMGGFPGETTSIDKFTQSTEETALVTSTLTQMRMSGATSQSYTHGYYLGGSRYLFVNCPAIDKISFSTEAVSNIGNVLTSQTLNNGRASSPIYGYRVMGLMYNTLGNTVLTNTERIYHIAETTSIISATLSPGENSYWGSVQNQVIASYHSFGSGAPDSTELIKFDLGTETPSYLDAHLVTQSGHYPGGTVMDWVAGYFDTRYSGGTNYINRLEFFTEATSLTDAVYIYDTTMSTGTASYPLPGY